MPRVRGFLRVIKRGRPGKPDIGLPDEEGEVDPGYGVDEGLLPEWPEGPEVEPPDPPVGIWPSLTPEHPWRPIDPGFGNLPGLPVGPGQGLPGGGLTPPAGGIGGTPPARPHPGGGEGEAGQLPVFPPGAIWPPLPPGVHGKYLALVLLKGAKGWRWHYIVVDADHKFPPRPVDPGYGVDGPVREPK